MISHTHRRFLITTRRGFTLIELLTVIAIIGILAAILIPTVGSVRKTAQTSACAANLRQIALGVILYAQDNKDMLPSGRAANGDWLGIFRGIREPSTAAGVSFTDAGAQLSNHISRYIGTGRSADLWLCPGNTAGQRATTRDGASPNNRMNYLVNNRGQGFSNLVKTNPVNFFGNDSGTATERRPKRIAEIANGTAAGPSSSGTMADGTPWREVGGLSKIWMITDMDSVNYSNSTSFIPAADAPDAVPMPHKDGRNYVFFDGHVELRKAANLPA
ncbi:MAG: prepilin-type N-terminal cleavage/methylation domain-containing protein, partial [Opitutaceae bacterium]|nr:prepilin-type N-terminal cleavage/methylation domain-containing protein [Opitutaceae bacterium]